MKTAKYQFEGVEFNDISGADLPANIRELYVKASKSMQRSLNRKDTTKDKRAECIQLCYVTILKKGLPDFTIPSAQDLDFRNFKSYEAYKKYTSKLECDIRNYIGVSSTLYAEPLRVAVSMFK